ncbi:MAG TPA: AAA family ATPase [Novimethylophilus sp.]|jgi:type II secretory pathway predicted ATPase ExeA|uniref:AAA family ATPase n=1 Tax=Novimethylophilus sp. TaxID=2137426 RepID=UPI002F3FCED9
MYYAHFGLKQPPFKITPNTEFFFSGGNRGAVLDALVYAITSGEGIVKVVGEVGSGKTMLCRMLESMLPENVERVYLANPSVAPEDILHAIAFELQLDLPQDADRLQVMQALQKHLIERHSQGRQVVIFVEEAQGMPLTTLEEIRLLSNLETKHDKLLQIVLFGQPELDANLNQQHIRQLKERITHSFNLGPLADHDIGDYLIYRLRTAGYFGPPLFTKSAVKGMAKASQGLVRRINILADKAMLAAFAENTYIISPKHINVAIKDSEFGMEDARPTQSHATYWIAAAMLLIGLGLGFGVHSWVPSTADRPAAGNSTGQVQTPFAKTAAAPSAASASPPATPAAPEAPVPGHSAAAPVAVALATEHEVPAAPQARESSTDILEKRLQATREWLSQQPPGTVSIQIMGTDKPEQMRKQLLSLQHSVELDKLFVYRTTVKGMPFMNVVYGSYPERAAAYKALAELPAALRAHRPHLRTVGGILEETKTVQ